MPPDPSVTVLVAVMVGGLLLVLLSLLLGSWSRYVLAGRRAHQLCHDAIQASGEQADCLLAMACAECESVIRTHPRHAFTLHVWGYALVRQAMRADPGKAVRLFQSAEEKFTTALRIKPHDRGIQVNRIGAIMRRGELTPGDAGWRLLALGCQGCEQSISEQPHNSAALHCWGNALYLQATRAPAFEALAYMPKPKRSSRRRWQSHRKRTVS